MVTKKEMMGCFLKVGDDEDTLKQFGYGIAIPPPGRGLDAVVAEKVMGWRVDSAGTEWAKFTAPGDIFHGEAVCPEFSTSIGCAWEIVEMFHKKGVNFAVGPTWCDVYVAGDQKIGLSGNNAPHAICLAALEAVAKEI